jgi:anti-sigma factor RsiW
MTTANCPPASSLSAWLDDELSSAEAQQVRDHLTSCAGCRGAVLRWVEAVNAIESPKSAQTNQRPECPSTEVLVAYSDGELAGEQASRTEEHLLNCAHCVRVTQRLIAWKLAVGDVEAAATDEHAQAQRQGWRVIARRLRGILAVLRRGRDAGTEARRHRVPTFARPLLPAAGALAVLLLIVALRSMPVRNGATDVGFRAVGASKQLRVLEDSVTARARPGDNQTAVATLVRGSTGRFLQTERDWTRIELPDGRRVWVRSTEVELVAEGGTR